MNTRSILFLSLCTLATTSFALAGDYPGGDIPRWNEGSSKVMACHLNPALSCNAPRVKSSRFERVQKYGGFSDVYFLRQSVGSYSDSSSSLEHSSGGFELSMFSKLSDASAFGLLLYNPMANSTLRQGDSLRLSEKNPSLSASLWMAVDLLSFLKNKKQLWILGSEIPIFYDPGSWEIFSEWVWKNTLRIGSAWSWRKPRLDMYDEIRKKNRRFRGDNSRWKSFVGLALPAGFLFSGYYEWKEQQRIAIENELSDKGWEESFGAEIAWKSSDFRLSLLLDQGKEKHAFRSSNPEFPLSQTTDGENRLFRGELDWNLLENNRLITFIQQADLREKFSKEVFQSAFREGGVSWSSHFSSLLLSPGLMLRRGDTKGLPDPWTLWGIQPELSRSSEKTWSYQVWTAELKIGMESWGSRFLYTFRTPLAVTDRLSASGTTISLGNEHHLEIRSHF